MIKACLAPRCPDPATYRGRCQRHARQRERSTHLNKAFYNSKRWQMTRKAQLFRESLCEAPGCQEIATDVDHILPIEHGGDRWAPSNLQSLCRHHHGVKTRREQSTRG